MLKLLKYEFKNSKSLYSLFAFIILLIYIAQFVLIKTEGFSNRVDYIMIVPLASLPIFLVILASEILGVNNEITKERQMLVYYTPNSLEKVVGAKLLRSFIAVLALSLLINVLNWIIGYVPFMMSIGATADEVSLAPMWENTVRVFSILWNTTAIVALIACMYFFITLEAGVSSIPFLKHIVRVAAVTVLLFGYIIIMNLFMKKVPISIVIDNDIYLRWGHIAKDAIRESSRAILPVDTSKSIIALFYQDKSKIVLGVAPIIYNIIVALVFYPLTVLVMKKKVFS